MLILSKVRYQENPVPFPAVGDWSLFAMFLVLLPVSWQGRNPVIFLLLTTIFGTTQVFLKRTQQNSKMNWSN